VSIKPAFFKIFY